MSKTDCRVSVTIRTAQGDERTLEGRAAIVLTVDDFNGNRNLTHIGQAFYGRMQPVEIARHLLKSIRDQEESAEGDFWQCVVAILLGGLYQSANGEDISGMIDTLTEDEAFARDAIDKAEGKA